MAFLSFVLVRVPIARRANSEQPRAEAQYLLSAIGRAVLNFFADFQFFAGFRQKDALRTRECLLPK